MGNGEAVARPRVGWFELFYDLVVVALVLHGSDLFRSSATFETGVWLAVTLVVALALWLATTITFNTTGRDWPLRRDLVLIQMLAMVIASLAISRDSGLGDNAGFLALAVAFATLAVLYWIKRTEPKGHRSSTVMAYSLGAAAVACVGGSIVGDASGPRGISLAAVALGLAVLFVVVPLLTVVLGELVSSGHLDREHLAERIGQLVLIALGESFAALIVSLGDLDTIPDPVFFVLTFAVVYAVWTIYFRTVLPSGLPHGVWRTRAWIATHYLLIFGVIGTADVFSALTLVSMQEGFTGLTSSPVPLPLLYVLVAFALLSALLGASSRRIVWVHTVAAFLLLGISAAGLMEITGERVPLALAGGVIILCDAVVVGVMERSRSHKDKRARRDSNPQPTG